MNLPSGAQLLQQQIDALRAAQAVTRLARHRPADFEVLIPSPAAPCAIAKATWKRMGSDWSTDAAPGDWVRIRPRVPLSGDDNHVDTGPEGIVIAALSHHQIGGDVDRFLILWFR